MDKDGSGEGPSHSFIRHARWTHFIATTDAAGKEHGVRRFYTDCHLDRVSIRRHGRRHGPELSFYPESHAVFGVDVWNEGRREEVALRWSEDGTLTQRGQFREGYAVGTWQLWYDDGTPEAIAHFAWPHPDDAADPGSPLDEATGHAMAGCIHPCRPFEGKPGVREGEWMEWWPNGQLKRRESYHLGRLAGRSSSWNDEGCLFSCDRYEDGNKVGSWHVPMKNEWQPLECRRDEEEVCP